MSVLAKEPLGSFMVRNSETQPGTFALSVRVPKSFHPLGITHYIIHQLEEGYQIKVTKNVDQKMFRKEEEAHEHYVKNICFYQIFFLNIFF